MKKVLCILALLALPLLMRGDSPHSFSFSESFVNQTGTLPTTTLFTATTGGDFLVTVYLENVTPIPTSSAQAIVSWTDDVQTKQASLIAATSTNQSNSIVLSVHIAPGQSLLLNASDFGANQNYTIYVTAHGQ